MKIDGKAIAGQILTNLAKETKAYIKKGITPPRLIIFSINPTEETQLFMRNKKRAAEIIGAESKLILYRKTPRFEDFANKVSHIAHDSGTSGVVIQEPLPASFSTVTLTDYIPAEKEIEGFKKKSTYDHPIGLAVFSAINSIYSPTRNIITSIEKEAHAFKGIIKNKKIVVLGRGKTGGKPIGNSLSKARMNYININSITPASVCEEFIRQADIIISAVGKNVIKADMVKAQAVLISIGMRMENGKWVGDYYDKDIENNVLAYTPTPGGIGAMNVAFLMYNLVKAWKTQHKLQ